MKTAICASIVKIKNKKNLEFALFFYSNYFIQKDKITFYVTEDDDNRIYYKYVLSAKQFNLLDEIMEENKINKTSFWKLEKLYKEFKEGLNNEK